MTVQLWLNINQIALHLAPTTQTLYEPCACVVTPQYNMHTCAVKLANNIFNDIIYLENSM